MTAVELVHGLSIVFGVGHANSVLLGHEITLSGSSDSTWLASWAAGASDFFRLVLLRVLHIESQLDLLIISAPLDHSEGRNPRLDGHLHADMALVFLDLHLAILGLNSLAMLTGGLRLALADLGIQLLHGARCGFVKSLLLSLLVKHRDVARCDRPEFDDVVSHLDSVDHPLGCHAAQ